MRVPRDKTQPGSFSRERKERGNEAACPPTHRSPEQCTCTRAAFLTIIYSSNQEQVQFLGIYHMYFLQREKNTLKMLHEENLQLSISLWQTRLQYKWRMETNTEKVILFFFYKYSRSSQGGFSSGRWSAKQYKKQK